MAMLNKPLRNYIKEAEFSSRAEQNTYRTNVYPNKNKIEKRAKMQIIRVFLRNKNFNSISIILFLWK
jgi:hypothetical protein